MHITCPRRPLQAALAAAGRALSSRSTLPILQNTCVEAQGGADTATLTATDLELGLVARVAASVHVPGRLTVPAKTLHDLVGALQGEAVTIRLDERNSARVECGRARYTLAGLPPEEFPPLPEVGEGLCIELTEARLAGLLRVVLPCTSGDDTRPVLTGLSLSLEGCRLTAAATDTHRLAVWEDIVRYDGEGTRLLPGRALEILLPCLSGDGERVVTLRADENQAEFTVSGNRLVTRLIEGQFPKWSRVVPQRHDRTWRVSVREFSGAVRRAGIVGQRDGVRKVRLSAGDGTLVVEARSAEGEAREEVAILAETGGSEGFAVTLNAAYVLDTCAAFDAEEMVLETTEPLQPVMVRPGEGEYFHLWMPMQEPGGA